MSIWDIESFLDNKEVFLLIMSISIVSLIISILIIPVLLIKMPCDYFMIKHIDYVKNRVRHPILRFIIHLIKNSLGTIFLLSGIVLLFIPGQGILTILIGVSLLDLPFKRKIEYKIISKPVVLNFVNRIRRRAGEAVLEV